MMSLNLIIALTDTFVVRIIVSVVCPTRNVFCSLNTVQLL